MAPPLWRPLALLFAVAGVAFAKTDKNDVSALNVLYSSLNSPSQLTGWSSNGGDPCDDGWRGIECSGSSVTEINLSSFGLTGTLGYQLSSLTSVTKFDVGKNNIHGDIPYQLPPNAVEINFAANALTGSIPYSISQMTDLKSLNLANNQLSGQLIDMFGNLKKLSFLDVSSNRLSSELPQSFTQLSSLKTLHVQNNQFSGDIKVLGNLPLEDLNLQNNKFTGWIPNKLKKLDNLEIGGNSWSSGPAPAGMSKAADVDSNGSGSKGGKSSITAVMIAVIVIAILVLVVIILSIVKKKTSSSASHYLEGRANDSGDSIRNRSFTPLVGNESKEFKESTSIDMKSLQSSYMEPTTPPANTHKSFNDNEHAKKFSADQSTDPFGLTTYALSALLSATENFSTSHLLGQGTIGKVFKGDDCDGKVLAFKKVDTMSFSGGSHEFMEIVKGISKLHHSNICGLLGYCSEPGYNLLVYEFQRNGSLNDFLHLSDAYSRPLTWDTRIRIALGTARAIEYLHECSPPVIHKNIKSSNILLDSELNPLLIDSGLATFYQDTSENLGAGYNPPECTKSGYILRSDIYSFGVVMLELLTGRKPYDSTKPLMEHSLVRWAAPQLHNMDALGQIVDPALRGLYPPKSLSRFADVIALCVQADPNLRPSMTEVVQSIVRCVQRSSINKRFSSELSASRRSDDSDW